MKQLKKVLGNQSGVAILMVMSAVALLAFLLADFTYETKLNKIKVYNQQDKLQARLAAEAGLKFAMAKLLIYKEARNIYEKNDNIRQFLTADKLESILTQPFLFPINEALLAAANPIQRSAVQEFSKNILLKGQVSVTMKGIAGLINVNAMRFPGNADSDGQDGAPPADEQPDQDQDQDQGKKKSTDAFTEDELRKLLEERLSEKREKDENFDALYGSPDVNMRVKEIKYFVNREEDFQDPEKGELEALYQGTNLKHAPMASISEIYLLKGWNDKLIELVKDELTVHAATIIPINKITKGQLKALFPALTEDQLKEFFKIKEGNKEEDRKPKVFKTVDDLKQVLVEQIQALEASTFDQRIKEYADAGIQFGAAGKLFKVTSKGTYGRAVYSIQAYVDMPIKPEPKKKKGPTDPNPQVDEEGNPIVPDQQGQQGKDGKEAKKTPLELMNPRIIELQIL